MLDGVEGGLTGVMLLNEGRILGGDASFYYIGSYTSEDGRWKGQILNQEHTRPAKGENPVFGGHEVGIGFSAPAMTRGHCSMPPRSPASESPVECGPETDATAVARWTNPCACSRHWP